MESPSFDPEGDLWLHRDEYDADGGGDEFDSAYEKELEEERTRVGTGKKGRIGRGSKEGSRVITRCGVDPFID